MLIARQPIFNKATNLYGYELLYRTSAKSQSYDGSSSKLATASVISGLFEQGIDRIVGSSRAFINFDYDFIMSDSLELINPSTMIIEVLENVIVDDILINRLKYLKDKGYKIALDDFEAHARYEKVMPIVSIIKYDIMITPLETIKSAVEKSLNDNKIILAEKVETKEQFELAIDMGFHLFQGYFFSKPIIVGEANDKKISKLQYIRVINELKKEEPSFNEITSIIHSDVNLAYRVMKIMSNKKDEETSFSSIKEALLKMGLRQIERWINLLMLQDFSKNKPLELLKLSLVRSKFGEYIANRTRYKEQRDEISMMCLFSTLDALLDQDMEEALSDLSLSKDVYDALVHKKGNFQPIYSLVISYEKGEWNHVNSILADIKLDARTLYSGYMQSILWASRIIAILK